MPRCLRLEQRRDVAQAELADVDDVEIQARAFDQVDLLLDVVGLGRDRVHHAVAAAARVRRHLEHVDDCVVDVEIDQILDAPPHGRAQLVGRHVGRFDEQQPVTAGIEHTDRRCTAIRQPRQHARDRISCRLLRS